MGGGEDQYNLSEKNIPGKHQRGGITSYHVGENLCSVSGMPLQPAFRSRHPPGTFFHDETARKHEVISLLPK